jgi:serine/threonine-protein kinase
MLRVKKRFYAGITAILLGLAIIVVYHFSGETPVGNEPEQARQVNADATGDNTSFSSQADRETREKSLAPPPEGHQLAESLIEGDGAVLRLIAAGTTVWQPDHMDPAIRTESLSPFYIEEEMVTNARYVAYLNAVRNLITVRDMAVYYQGNVLFLLGEVREGHQPVVFRDDRFSVSDAVYAGYPVVRVTPEGALAYAHYYNRDLPTPAQWNLARTQGRLKAPLPGTEEWGYEKNGASRRYFSLTAPGKDDSAFCPILRQAWESLSNAGFRTVRLLTRTETAQ